ncbi:MAG: hypothetical protein K6A74_09820 [Lachnospiraceae bacterium]|nr:hypothetical protein [Lachnospiraceae bacterium]
MSSKDFEGQLDFLGLITEYTDDQGATVRIREPGRKRVKPIPPPEFEQITLELTPEEPKAELKPEPKAEMPKAEVKEAPKAVEKPAPPEPKEEPKPEPKAEPKPVPKPVPKEEPKSEPKPIPKEEPKPAPKPAPKPKAPAKTEPPAGEMLFKQCKSCWCFDCKHNKRNDGVPRDFGGMSMPCPACDGCVAEDMATICEIGNAKEGCMTRALEEGIVVQEEDI